LHFERQKLALYLSESISVCMTGLLSWKMSNFCSNIIFTYFKKIDCSHKLCLSMSSTSNNYTDSDLKI
jgi:hypothetical protein